MGVSIWKLKGIGFVHHSMWMIMTYDPPPKLKAKCQLLILNFKTWYAFIDRLGSTSLVVGISCCTYGRRYIWRVEAFFMFQAKKMLFLFHIYFPCLNTVSVWIPPPVVCSELFAPSPSVCLKYIWVMVQCAITCAITRKGCHWYCHIQSQCKQKSNKRKWEY